MLDSTISTREFTAVIQAKPAEATGAVESFVASKFGTVRYELRHYFPICALDPLLQWREFKCL